MSAVPPGQAEHADAPGEVAALELGSRWADAVARRHAEALVEVADPNIAFYPTHLFGDHGPYLGHDGLRRWIAGSVAKDFPLSVQVTDVRHGQAGTVVTLGHVLAHGKPVSPFAMVVTLRDDKIAEARAYLSGEAELKRIGRVGTEDGSRLTAGHPWVMRLMPDGRLFTSARCGDRRAAETLIDRYYSRLLAFCRLSLSSTSHAEELVRELRSVWFDEILAAEPRVALRPCLYRAVRSRCRVRLEQSELATGDPIGSRFDRSGQRYATSEAASKTLADLRRLEEDQRTALLLREIGALPYQEIAITMETTVDAVKRLLVRGRVAFAEASQARSRAQINCSDRRLIRHRQVGRS